MSLTLSVFAAVLGAVVGSFLNACIHRMPRGISLDNPRRSFCPACQKQIPWFENLPVVSWLALRGKCSKCGARISPRYLLVEVLTAALFLLAWQWHGLPLAPVYWVFLALLVVATFIDIEFFIIPDEITYGGTAAGILFSLALPGLMQVDSRWVAGALSLAGAALGFGLLWLIVELGKLAFGKKRHVLNPAERFAWKRDGDRATITMGGETLAWEDVFSRESDQLVIECESATFGGRTAAACTLRFHYNRLTIEEAGGPAPDPLPLDTLDTVDGLATVVTVPREAMGFGDVKFIAAIGAFLGWKAVLFTLAAASIIGCVAALAGIFIARDRAGARVPFGPFLALGAAIWVFGGEVIWNWYFGSFGRLEEF